jgi:outer membrane protein OmpA-like peptidoglycan-associated protein
MNLEDSDRIARFQRLADEEGIEPPTVEQIYAPAGTVPGLSGPVPVVRVSFDEGVFFDTDQDTPLPDSLAVLNLIAQNMQRDVPDAALTIIGNTDSTGTDAYNDNLSERRAIHVMKLLTEDGLDPLQMLSITHKSERVWRGPIARRESRVILCPAPNLGRCDGRRRGWLV